MTVSASIAFAQPGGGGTGVPGFAMIGAKSLPVTVSNGNDSGVTQWTFAFIDVPRDSSVPTGIVQTGATPTYTFTPDQPGSYEVQITTTDGTTTATDTRVFIVPESTGQIMPAFEETSAMDNYPLTVGHNDRGWARAAEDWLRTLDTPLATLTSGPIALTSSNAFIEFNGASGISATLPAAARPAIGPLRRFYYFKNKTNQTNTILPAGADTIDGGASLVLTGTGAFAVLATDGISNWDVIAGTSDTILSGNVTGPVSSTKVVAWENVPLDATTMSAPSDGYVPVYNGILAKWKAVALASLIALSGDVNGTLSANHVDMLTGPGTGLVTVASGTNFKTAGTSFALKDSGSVTRFSWDMTTGAAVAGGGGTDYQVRIGPLPTSSTVSGTLHILPQNTAPSASNWIIYGTNTAIKHNIPNASGTWSVLVNNGNTYFTIDGNAQTVTLSPAGFNVLVASSSTVTVQKALSISGSNTVTINGLSGSGAGYATVSNAGVLGFTATIPSGSVAPGTAGQVFITNGTPAAVWTSLISVETTHGRFTAGGSGSDFKTVIGPLVANETLYAGLWMLAGATAPSISNPVVYSDGSGVFINTVAAGGVIGFVSAGATVLAEFNWTSSRFYLGGSNGAAPLIVDWASAAQTQILAGSGQTSMLIGTTDATATLDILADNAARVIRYAGGTQAGYALGSNLATAGHWRIPESFTWLARNNANTANLFIMAYSTDDLVIGDNSLALMNFVSGGTITFHAGSAQYAQVCADQTYFATSAGTSTVKVTPGATTTLIDFIQCTNASIILDAAASDVATGTLTIRGQYAFATATLTNRTPGSIVFDLGAPTNGSTTEASINLSRNGTTIVTQTMTGGSTDSFNTKLPTGWQFTWTVDSAEMLLAPTQWVVGGPLAWWFSGVGTQVGFGGNSPGGSPILVDFTTSTTPFIQSSTSATSLTLGTNKSGATLKLAGDANVGTVLIGNTNIQLCGVSASFGGGTGVVGVTNATAVPTTNPSGGGILYADSGAGKWRGSSGTLTTFGPADLEGFKDTSGHGHCPVCGTDFALEWQNEEYGSLTVCMKCLTDEIGDRPWIVRKAA